MWEEKRGKKEKCLKLFLAYKDTGDFFFFFHLSPTNVSRQKTKC